MSCDPRTLSFQAIKWQCEELDEEIIIHLTGITEKNESVHVQIQGFQPFAFIELPNHIEWNEENQNRAMQYFEKKMGMKKIEWAYEQKYLCRYKTPAEFIKVTLPTNKLLNQLSYKVYDKKGYSIPGLGFFQFGDFRMHEHNIDPIIKYTAMKNLVIGGWVTVTERSTQEMKKTSVEERKYTSCDIDMNVFYTKVKACETNGKISSKIVSFDIETYSKNKNSKHPNPEIKENCVFQIALKCGRLNEEPEMYTSYLLSLCHCPPIEGSEVRNFKSERELILGFCDIIHTLNPDIFIGYNILKFDWEYLLRRAAHTFNGCYNTLLKTGRIYGKKSVVETVKWTSSAYGEQKFDYLNPDGRVNMDLLPEVERNFKLDTYNLNAVSELFLKENKEDMPYKQMFTLFEMAQLYEKMLPKKITLSRMKAMLKKCMEVEDFIEPEEGDRRNHVLEIWNMIKQSTARTIGKCIREGIYRIGVYCIQDTLLPVKLFQKLNLWEGLTQMANVTCVPTWYLQTRGQQIKVLAQYYRRTLRANVVIEYRKADLEKEDDTKYQGATVITAVPGLYRDVANLDFASLYPSIIIARNICHTTLVRDDDPTPDSECHVIEWDEHRGCTHDTSGKKCKPEDILCGSHRYRFRKKEFGGEGLLPAMLRDLLSERKKVKGEMKVVAKKIKEEKDEHKRKMLEVDYSILDARQLGLKVSANSAYGFLGARKGYCPLKEGAASVTAEGRRMIQSTANLITNKYENAKVIYGDTDSVMVQFEADTIEEKFKLADEAAAYVTETFIKPNELENECMYDPYILMTKKRYATNIIDKERNILKVSEKGVLSARRDNFHFIRLDLYKKALSMIRNYEKEDDVMYYLITTMNSMFQRRVPFRKFVLYMSVKDLAEYDVDAKNVNAMLARKMAERGDDVANTRLEFLFLQTHDRTAKKGAKAEDWSYFLENYRQKNLKIDYLTYLEKCINPFTELFQIVYPKKEVLYEKTEDALERQINLLEVPSNTEFSLERMSHIRKTKDKIAYIKMYLKREEHNSLFNACDRYIARDVLDRLYKKHGLIKRPPTQRPKKGEVTIRNDAKLMTEFHKAHKHYHEVVEHLNEMFSPIEFEDE